MRKKRKYRLPKPVSPAFGHDYNYRPYVDPERTPGASYDAAADTVTLDAEVAQDAGIEVRVEGTTLIMEG